MISHARDSVVFRSVCKSWSIVPGIIRVPMGSLFIYIPCNSHTSRIRKAYGWFFNSRYRISRLHVRTLEESWWRKKGKRWKSELQNWKRWLISICKQVFRRIKISIAWYVPVIIKSNVGIFSVWTFNFLVVMKHCTFCTFIIDFSRVLALSCLISFYHRIKVGFW